MNRRTTSAPVRVPAPAQQCIRLSLHVDSARGGVDMLALRRALAPILALATGADLGAISIISARDDARTFNGMERCPFCGNWPITCESPNVSDYDHYVFCPACFASGPLRPSKEAAVSAWNHRGQP